MALKTFKPITPGLRQLVIVDRSELYKGKPVKALTEGKSSSGGRNNLGRVTVRFRGGAARSASGRERSRSSATPQSPRSTRSGGCWPTTASHTASSRPRHRRPASSSRAGLRRAGPPSSSSMTAGPWSTRRTPSWRPPTGWRSTCPRTRASTSSSSVPGRGDSLPRSTRPPRACDARRRAGVDRRPGGVELADPQLPRLRARSLGRRARPAGLPAGVGVRLLLRALAGGRVAGQGRRRFRRGHRARSDRPRLLGRPRDGCLLPPTRGGRAAPLRVDRPPLRRLRVRGEGPEGRPGLRRGKWQLGGSGGSVPREVRAPGDPARSGNDPRLEHVAVPHRRPVRGRRGGAACGRPSSGEAGRGTRPRPGARPRHERGLGGADRRGLPAHRRVPAHRVVAGHDPSRPVGVRAHRRGRRCGGRAPAWPHDEPPQPLETSVQGVFAVGDVRRGHVLSCAWLRVLLLLGEGDEEDAPAAEVA